MLLVAGGTGGHLIPALTFHQWLGDRGEESQLVTGSRPLEAAICDAHSVKPLILPLEGSPLGGGLSKLPRRSLQMLRSIILARRLLKKYRPDCCVLFGGYLSLPFLLVCRFLGVSVVLHEQNTVAGRVTRLASRLGCLVATGWKVCHGLKEGSWQPTGIPTRKIQLGDRREAQKKLLGFSLDEGQHLMVILGGSLGSSGMGKVLANSGIVVELTNWRVLFPGLSSQDCPFPEALTCQASWDMTLLYSAADLLVCRAGAATLAEVLQLQLQALIVPWTEALDGHQAANARMMKDLTGTPFWLEGADKQTLPEALCEAWKGDRNWPCDNDDPSLCLWQRLRKVTMEGRR